MVGHPIIIGVTGGLASGKTTVAKMLAKKGGIRIDADKIGHELLRDVYGVKNRIDRAKLANRVFDDKKKLKELCKVLHPKIIKCIRDRIKKNRKSAAIVDAPLLIESGFHRYVDIVIVVGASKKLEINRASARGIPRKMAKRIIQNQMPFSEKIKSADYTIHNNKSISILKKGVDEIWQRILKTKKTKAQESEARKS